MTQKHKIQLFENKNVRTVWDDELEEWYFSIVDVCGVLTESKDPQAYWRKLKQRLKDEGNETVTNLSRFEDASPRRQDAHDGCCRHRADVPHYPEHSFEEMTWWKALLVSCGISVTIEALQFLFMRGFSEVDDVMHNTLGCLIGWFMVKGSWLRV